jgi:O-6-methylguanine DNA methyltransferase
MPWRLFETSLGACGVSWNDEGVTSLQLPEETPDATKERLFRKARDIGARASARTTPEWVVQAIGLVTDLLAGRPRSLTDVPLDLSSVSEFDAKVYRALRRIPAGQTTTYGELARSVGSAGAARAVGRAMATNPIPILVPCHRVLAAGGKPGGFSAYGGVITKDRILALEGAKDPTMPLFAASPPRAIEELPALPYDRAAALAHLASVDPVLAAHVRAVGAFTLALAATESAFGALAQSIVYQQLNGKAAATIFGRVRALFPRGRLEPKTLLTLSDDSLRGAGLSRGKLAAVRDLATRAAAGDIPTLPQLQRMDDEAIVEALTEVRGIGRWTVEMLLIFRLGRPDVLPVADYGIRKGFARVFHRGKRREELPTEEALAKRGERWRPFRSVASWYLWRAVD